MSAIQFGFALIHGNWNWLTKKSWANCVGEGRNLEVCVACQTFSLLWQRFRVFSATREGRRWHNYLRYVSLFTLLASSISPHYLDYTQVCYCLTSVGSGECREADSLFRSLYSQAVCKVSRNVVDCAKHLFSQNKWVYPQKQFAKWRRNLQWCFPSVQDLFYPPRSEGVVIFIFCVGSLWLRISWCNFLESRQRLSEVFLVFGMFS